VLGACAPQFFDAQNSSPRDAHQILEWIRQLYDVEERARELSTDARRKMRMAEATPVLDRIGTHLAELEQRALPKSVLAKAVSYARNQWQALCRYTEDGRLSIDNNVSERTLRHQAIGRKNRLFLGSEQAGSRAAVLFTILAGAKRHRIEPWTYLRELLLRLHDDSPRLDEMLPDQWAIHHPEAVLNYRLEESRRKAATRSSRRRHTRTMNRSH
jgi:transposase